MLATKMCAINLLCMSVKFTNCLLFRVKDNIHGDCSHFIFIQQNYEVQVLCSLREKIEKDPILFKGRQMFLRGGSPTDIQTLNREEF